MRIEREHAIALAIDYQERLVPVMDKKSELIENSGILLAGLRELGVPIVVTQQYTKGLGKTVPEIVEAIGSPEYVEKIRFSACDVVEEKIHAKKYVIVCGVEAHICVLQTVIDLKSAGYIPVLVTDCISSRKAYNREMAVQRAIQEGAVVTTCEALLFELLEEAGTAKSKKIQRLVK